MFTRMPSFRANCGWNWVRWLWRTCAKPGACRPLLWIAGAHMHFLYTSSLHVWEMRAWHSMGQSCVGRLVRERFLDVWLRLPALRGPLLRPAPSLWRSQLGDTSQIRAFLEPFRDCLSDQSISGALQGLPARPEHFWGPSGIARQTRAILRPFTYRACQTRASLRPFTYCTCQTRASLRPFSYCTCQIRASLKPFSYRTSQIKASLKPFRDHTCQAARQVSLKPYDHWNHITT